MSGLTLEVPEPLLTSQISTGLKEGKYEWGELRALKNVLRPEDRLLDIGSAIGFIACQACLIIEPEQLTCVEANPELIPVLEGNLARNGFIDARVCHGAVVEDTFAQDELSFQLNKSYLGSRIDGVGKPVANRRTVTVPALRLADLLVAFEPTVVMMDVEGVEVALTQHLWPGRTRVVIMEIHPQYYGLNQVDELFAGMARNGFAYQPYGSRGAVVVFQRIGTE
ncbi:FkbM family methyltransferase [Aliiroseovarius crassostreae]|uniref:FkbM family methyltransferase n=1 Tax=Aliiroseovarius crassostreae TaxID=154981 RepID=UPI003C7C7FC3